MARLAGAQELHRDGDLSLLDLAHVAGVDHAVSVIWALDAPFTDDRGATRVCPGSHEWPSHLGPAPALPATRTARCLGGGATTSTVPSLAAAAAAAAAPLPSAGAVMARGSALVYIGRTVHGAGHNRTEAPRVAFNVAYNSACLKQEENMYTACPPDVAATFPAALRELIGYF